MLAIRNVYTKKRHQMNFVPFIDVVFMLLIYFFVAAEIRPTEADFNTNLPDWGEGRRNPAVKPEVKEIYRVYLKALDPAAERVQVSVNSTVLGDGPEAFQVLAARLESISDKAHMVLVIDGDSNITVQSIAHALDAAMTAKVPAVSFARPKVGS